jgi:ketosteroid isomerase-like protein
MVSLVTFAGLWLLATTGVGAAAEVPGATAIHADDTAIRTLIGTYARSIDAADTELAATIWSSSPEVSFTHPRGRERGWPTIKARFYEQTMGATFSARKLSVKNVVIHSYGETAWAEFEWDFTATLRKDESPLETHGRETQIYRKAEGSWRIVHIHYSAIPVTGERQGF